MKTLTNGEVARLSVADWHRIHRVLRKQFVDFDGGNISNIAFGAKQAKRPNEIQPGNCVRFLVRYKRTPRAKVDRIDPWLPVRFRLKRNKKLVQIVLRTDVEQVGELVATGSQVVDNQLLAEMGVTGLAVDVEHQAFGQTFHARGFVTVGHPYERLPNPSEPRDVTGQRRDASSVSIPGRIRQRSFPRERNSKFDGAFAETSLKNLRQANYLQSDGSLRATLSERELKRLADFDERGTILRPKPKGPAIITATDYIPETLPTFDPEFQVMRGVLRGEAQQTGVIYVGTSGSIWRFNNKIASIQFAAESGFRVGYSQSVRVLLQEWLKARFRAKHVRVLNSF